MEEWRKAKLMATEEWEWEENDARFKTAKAKFEALDKKYQEKKKVYDDN